MKISEIDRSKESHEARLANITVILYERLDCREEETKDFILQKLLDIKAFDKIGSQIKPNATLVIE